MKCKFCNEELPAGGHVCPVCGKDQRTAFAQEDAPMESFGAERNEDGFEEVDLLQQALDENWEPACNKKPQAPEKKPVKEAPIQAPSQLKKAKRIAVITGCIAALAVLATVLFLAIKGGWEVSDWFDWQIFRENTVNYKNSYTVRDKKAYNKRNDVVATLGDAELTNGQLQIYYWSEVQDYINQYYYQLIYLGLDYKLPLNEQKYTEDQTWQQYFLELALQSWQANQALALEAKANGYVLPEEYQQKLDNMLTSLEGNALKNGYESADDMVQDYFGPGCTAEDYVAYMEVYYYGYLYFEDLYNAINPTMDEIENYFVANEEKLKSEGITKEDGYTVDIRHILLKINTYAVEVGDSAKTETQAEEDDAEDEDANKDKYTEEQWEACRAEAQRILDLWLAGDMTEESFAELAKKHSEDGNAKDGGIYTGVTEGYMVDTFNDWCFDEERQVGDYGLVQTEFGYHVMYFVGSEEIWISACREAIIAEEAQKVVTGACERFTPDINYKKIILGEVTF